MRPQACPVLEMADGQISEKTIQSPENMHRLGGRLRSIVKAASLIYVALAMVGLSLLGYSYFTAPKTFQPIEMREDIPADEQAVQIQQWASQAIPATTTWFFPINRYISLRLEPGLPAEYAYLELPWDKKLAILNDNTSATLSSFYSCHWALFTFYLAAIGFGLWTFRETSVIMASLMVLLGLVGVPWLMAGFVQLDVTNPLWMAPLLLPGVVVFVTVVLELVLNPRPSEWQHHQRGFWLGVLVCVVSSVLLGLAIQSGGRLKANAGLGVAAGLLLMGSHGWNLIIQLGRQRLQRA